MIVLDTSGIVALANRADPNHTQAIAAVMGTPETLVVSSVILSEVAFVLTRRAGERAFVRFLDAMLAGQMLWHDAERELRRIRELIVRYENLPLGFADAAVVAAAEASRSPVLTFDRRHFEIVARNGTIQLLP